MNIYLFLFFFLSLIVLVIIGFIKFLPFIIIFLLIRYIFKQFFTSPNLQKKKNRYSESKDKQNNVIDVEYEELE